MIKAGKHAIRNMRIILVFSILAITLAACSIVCVYCALWGEANSSFNIVYELYTEDPFIYVLKGDNTYEIVGLTDNKLSEYKIPDEVNGKPVTSIADCGSYDKSIFYPARDAMTSIEFGKNIKSIGSYSFYHCKLLTDVVFNEGLEVLGKDAFRACDALQSITIPTTLKTFASHVFRDCRLLEHITYKAANADNLTEEDRPFYGCGSIDHDLEVTFTESVEHIPDYLFRSPSAEQEAIYLTEVTIGENVKTIGTKVFCNCYYLRKLNFNAIWVEDLPSSADVFYDATTKVDELEVNFGPKVQNIPAHIFHGTSSTTNYLRLKSLTIPESVTDIGASAFKYTFGIEHLYFNAINCNDMDSEDDIFYSTATESPNGCEVIIGDMVTRIPAHLLHGSSSQDKYNRFNKITIGAGVKEFGTYAFRNCYDITEVIYKAVNCNDVNSSAHPFDSCGHNSAGVTLTIDDSVESIPAYLFDTSSSTYFNVKTLIIGKGVTHFGTRAFAHFQYGETLIFNAENVPDLVQDEYVDKSPNIFYNFGENNPEGATLMIGETVTRIPDFLFYGYTDASANIKTLTIPESVQYIGQYAFPYFYNLQTINYNVIQFNQQHTDNLHVFYDAGRDVAEGVTLNIGASVIEIPDYLFYASATYYMNLKSLEIPDTVQRIGKHAFEYCMNLTDLKIGTGVKELGEYAFAHCNNLANIDYRIVSLSTDLTSDSNVFYRAGQDHVGLVVVLFSDDVVDIPSYLFCNSERGAATIDHVYIGANVKTIGHRAFEYLFELKTVIIGSETVYNMLTEISAAGQLIDYATQIIVKTTIVESQETNSFLESNYTRSDGEGDYVGFTVYTAPEPIVDPNPQTDPTPEQSPENP